MVLDAERAEKTLSLLKDKSVLVEGLRDEKALRSLGVAAKRAEGSPWRWVERHAASTLNNVVLLFDFDAEGKRKTKAFSEALLSQGVVPDNGLRKRVERTFGVSTIEELPTRFEEIAGLQKGEGNGKNLRGYRQILDKSKFRNRRHSRKAGHSRRYFWSD